jgi:DNA polymerase eta
MNTRIIIHVDLDAFYAQVEHVRLNIPLEQPLCVQQWNGLIAVNYAARTKGIKRHCTVKEALEKCPELKLVHVATCIYFIDENRCTWGNRSSLSYAKHQLSDP